MQTGPKKKKKKKDITCNLPVTAASPKSSLDFSRAYRMSSTIVNCCLHATVPI
jgi:hypothetical protein